MISEFKPLLKNSDFLYLWFSQIFSQLTINILNFVLLVRLFTTTGSSIAVSILWLSYALPAVLLGPVGAAAVDMVDRRKTLIVTNFLQTLTVFIYAVFHTVRPFLLYSVAFTYSLLNQFYVPAEAASLPRVVKSEELPHANSLFFLTQQGSLIVGFGIAGILSQMLGFEKTLFLCVFLLFIAFTSSFFLPPMKVDLVLPDNFEKGVKKFFEKLVEGYLFIKDNNRILVPLLLFLGLQVIISVISVNIPAISLEIFKRDPNSAGVNIIVPAAFGALLSAFIVPNLLKKGVRKKKIIDASLIGAAVTVFLLAFLGPGIAHDKVLFFTVPLVFTIGASFVGIFIPCQTFVQENTPKALFGRVFGNLWFLITILTIFPVIFAGALADLLGIKYLLGLIAGIIFLVFVVSKKYGLRIIS